MSHHHHHATLPGRVDGSGLLYGGVGLALGMAMQWLGLFKRGDARLTSWLLESVFHGNTPEVLSLPWMVFVTAVFCFGLAYAVLDSSGMWRRLILGVTALILLLAMVPSFAVWNLYFSPFLPVVGAFWTWFCTIMYVSHHVMPCDGVNSQLAILNPQPQPLPLTKPVVEDDGDKKYKPKEKLDG